MSKDDENFWGSIGYIIGIFVSGFIALFFWPVLEFVT